MDFWFIFRKERLLVRDGPEPAVAVPDVSPEKLGFEVLFEKPIGSLFGKRCFAAEVLPEAEAPEGMSFRDLRGMLLGIDEGFFMMAGRAKQIVGWNRDHHFCGRCGSETGPGPAEFAKKCPVCGAVYYPRLSPAAIMLITRGDEALLARSPHFPPGMYSALAGFVEPGESVEQTIAREVREEVGLEVRNPRYFGSQPWPFPDSLMLGFFAEYARGEITFDPAEEEIADAGWFSATNLPDLPPRTSIARSLVDHFLEHNSR